MNADLISALQEAVTYALLTYSPAMQSIGVNLVIALGTILIAWQGYTVMFRGGTPDQLWRFAQLLLFISLAYGACVYYSQPLPGLGVSFSRLILDQMLYVQRLLTASVVTSLSKDLTVLQLRFLMPSGSIFDVSASLQYIVITSIITLAQGLVIIAIAFPLVAQAVAIILGPLFVPWILIGPLSFIFYGWLRAVFIFSLSPVVAIAIMVILERYLTRQLSLLPPMMGPSDYMTFGIQTVVILATVCYALLKSTSIASALVSGHAVHGSPFSR